MKIPYIKALFLTAGIMALSSCQNTEDRIFDESSALRLNATAAEVSRLLQSSENGWAMDYYPYDTSWGGIAYAATFTDNKVTLYTEMNMNDEVTGIKYPAGTPITSVYEVKKEQSVVLSFDTYNLLFHYWSEPFSDTNADGYMSDYEFTVMEFDDNEIVMRGKKYGNTMRLTRLTTDCQDYINATVDNHERLKGIPRRRLMAGDRTIGISISGTMLSLETPDDKGTTGMPFTYTADGFRLYRPLTVNGMDILDFNLDGEGNLVSSKGDSRIPYPTMAEIFTGAATPWYFNYYITNNEYDMCDELRDIFLEAEATAQALPYYPNKFVAMTFGKSMSHKEGTSNYPECIGWEVMQPYRWQPLYVGYDVTFEALSDKEIGINPIGPGAFFLPTNYPDFNTILTPMLNYFLAKAPYIITDGDVENMRLVSADDDTCWFTMTIHDPQHWFD